MAVMASKLALFAFAEKPDFTAQGSELLGVLNERFGQSFSVDPGLGDGAGEGGDARSGSM